MIKPKVSIITPVYNGEKYLAKTIRSVQKQKFKNFEHIFIDDKSSDKSTAIIKKYKKNDPRIRLILRKKRSGSPAVGRNTGLKYSKGKFIAFLDHDDLWFEDKLEKEVKLLESKDDLVLVFSQIKMLLENGKIKDYPRIIPKNLNRKNQLRLLLKNNFIHPVSVLFKKEVVQKIGYLKPNLRGTDDFEFWLRIAKKYPIQAIYKPLAIWRKHHTSLSQKKEIKMHYSLISVLKNFKRDKNKKIKKEAEKTIARTYEDIGILYFRQKKWRRAKKYFKKAKQKIDLRPKVKCAYFFLKIIC